MDRPLPAPKRLKSLASTVQYRGSNTLLHKIVLDNSEPYKSKSESDIHAALMSICDINVNAVNNRGYTALHLAVLKKNSMMVRKLLSCLPDIDVDKKCGCNHSLENAALHMAAELGEVPIIEELLNKGASIDLMNKVKYTALWYAAQNGHLPAVESLMSRGADTYVEEPWHCPHHVAAVNDRLKVLQFLLGTVPNIDRNELLRTAARFGSMETLQFLLDDGADVNSADECGITPLLSAMKGSDNLAAAELLVSRGANVHARDDMGETVLHVAQDCSMISYLIERGVDLHAENNYGLTPLHTAAEKGFLEHVELLISKGARVNVRDKEGKTPLHLVCTSVWSEVRCAEVLIQGGADINAQDERGRTPLHAAMRRIRFVFDSECFSGEYLVQLLLEAGADVNLADRQGLTPLHVAAQEGHADVVRMLLENGAHRNAEDEDGKTPSI